jgi:hypothetical protein
MKDLVDDARRRRRAVDHFEYCAYCVVIAGLRGEFAAALSGGADSDDDRLACVVVGVVNTGLRGEFAAALPGGAHSDEARLACVGSAADVADGPTTASMNAASRTTRISRSMRSLLPEDSRINCYGEL